MFRTVYFYRGGISYNESMTMPLCKLLKAVDVALDLQKEKEKANKRGLDDVASY